MLCRFAPRNDTVGFEIGFVWVCFLNIWLGFVGLTLLFIMVYPVFEMLRLGLFFQIGWVLRGFFYMESPSAMLRNRSLRYGTLRSAPHPFGRDDGGRGGRRIGFVSSNWTMHFVHWTRYVCSGLSDAGSPSAMVIQLIPGLCSG